MNVKLITVTPNAEETMGYVARVSNPNNQDNPKVAGLLGYCIKHQHWSVFEQAHMTLEIETTRGIAAQILRHRSFTYQEFSQRYANTNMLGKIDVPDLRSQDDKNRQNSIETDNADLKYEWLKKQAEVAVAVKDAYNWALENGIAKEQARVVLPEGNTSSRLYMNGTLRSWMHYIELRSGNGTQKEHQEVAIECGKVLLTIFPIMEKFIN